MSLSTALPKAALYYYPTSVWCTVPTLALEEKGYAPDEIDLKLVDMAKGENYAPSYLRINPHATVPTLVVPLQNTLSPEVESRYKAIQDTKLIAEFLDKSRSTQSRTHTTSSAPSPSLSPATIAFNAISGKVISLVHSPPADPSTLSSMNGLDEGALRITAQARLQFLTARREALTQLLGDNESEKIRVSDKTRQFWEFKKVAADKFIDVLKDADKPADQLSDAERQVREGYFREAKSNWLALREVLLQLNQEIIGPYVLGDQLSLADLHLAAWLTRLIVLSGGTISEDGDTVISKLEAHTGSGFTLQKDLLISEARRRAGLPLPEPETDQCQNRLAAFWDAIKERESFKKVFAGGLY